MTTPTWALTLAYWLHMLATVAWVGSLAAITLLVLPAARKTLDMPGYITLLEGIQKRLDPLAWFSLVLLTGTGLVQMTGNPNYAGFLALNNSWAAAILLKHLVILGMVAVSASLTWGVLPRMRRVSLRLSQGIDVEEAWLLQRREARLIRINLVLSAVVLALTAIARTA